MCTRVSDESQPPEDIKEEGGPGMRVSRQAGVWAARRPTVGLRSILRRAQRGEHGLCCHTAQVQIPVWPRPALRCRPSDLTCLCRVPASVKSRCFQSPCENQGIRPIKCLPGICCSICTGFYYRLLSFSFFILLILEGRLLEQKKKKKFPSSFKAA